MPTSKDRKSISLNKKLCERFDYLYPRIIRTFCNRALELALQDKKYFEDVLFNPLFKEVR